MKRAFASIERLTRRAIAFALCPLSVVLLPLAFLGCDSSSTSTVVMTNVVTVTREVVVTNAVTVTNVVVERREPRRGLTTRRTEPCVVSSSVLTHRQLQDALKASAARILSLERAAVVEANEKILSALADRCGGTASIRPLGAESKLMRGAESGGRVIVRPVSAIDLPTVAAAVSNCCGEVVSELQVAGLPALVCKLSRKGVGELAARPEVWLIERYGKK